MANSLLPRWLQWSIDPANKNQPTFLGHFAISGSLILLVIVSYLVMFFGIAAQWEKDWLKCLPDEQIEQIKLPSTELTKIQINDKDIAVSSAESTRIKAQFKDVNSRAGKHCRIMAFFYKQYFISLLIGGVAGIVALICLFFVSKKGWEATNNALNNVCITAFGITFVFVNTTIMFKEADNLKASQDLFIGYIALDHELLSYWATGKQISNGVAQGVSPADFIYYVDAKIQTLNQVQLGFDPTPLLNIQGRVGQAFGISQGGVPAGVLPSGTAPPSPKITSPKLPAER